MDDQEKKDAQREATEDKMINDAFQHLLDTYLASRHRKKTDIITKAFNFARQAHKGVRRMSGEPYIMHPITVAQIACEEMGLGSTSICSALLHDVVEDTDYTVEDIENIFGHHLEQSHIGQLLGTWIIHLYSHHIVLLIGYLQLVLIVLFVVEVANDESRAMALHNHTDRKSVV